MYRRRETGLRSIRCSISGHHSAAQDAPAAPLNFAHSKRGSLGFGASESGKPRIETMRPTWQGNLKLALVLVPVKAYPAARVRAVRMNQLHEECRSRVRYQRRCPSCDRALETKEIVKGYEYGKDQYVLIRSEDLKKLQLPSLRTLDIVQFVDESEINPLHYHGSYYLAPRDGVAAGPFHTLLRAMRAARRVAIAQVVLSGKEKVVAIRPEKGVLLMSFLHYADEVREVGEIEDLPEETEANPAEAAMARQLLEAYTKPFELAAFEDKYRARFLEIVEAKSRGKELVSAPTVEPRRVINLMDALRSSLARIEGEGLTGGESLPDSGLEAPAAPEKRRAG